MHVHEPGVRRVPVAPDLFQQHLASEDLPGLAGQRDEQVELERSQADRVTRARHRVPGHVDGQVADGELLRRGRGLAPKPGADPSDELLGLERLDDVVVGAGLEAEHDVDRVGLGRQHHDRHPRLGPDLLADIDAVAAREHQVEQHQVGLGVPEDADGTQPVAAEDRVETLPPQHDSQHLGQGRIIIHYEYASPHGPIVAPDGRKRRNEPTSRPAAGLPAWHDGRGFAVSGRTREPTDVGNAGLERAGRDSRSAASAWLRPASAWVRPASAGVRGADVRELRLPAAGGRTQAGRGAATSARSR